MAMNETQINAVLDSPEQAIKLSDEQLDAATQDAIDLYGTTADPGLVEKLMLLYRHYVKRSHSAQRLRNYQTAVDRVLEDKSGVHVLMPFVCCDPARLVASTAALDYVDTRPDRQCARNVAGAAPAPMRK